MKSELPLEIEKKFLIKMPDLEWIKKNTDCTVANIFQTYLGFKKDGYGDRVRKMIINNQTKYYHTSKKSLTDMTRIELENEISEEATLSQSQAPEQNETQQEVAVARPNRADYDLNTTEGRENYIWQRLRSAGFSEVQVAAILGNMYVENTTLKLSLEEAGNNIGYGLIQWSFGRRTNLENFAKETGRSVNDIDVQLEFFIHEYNTDGWGAHTSKHAEFRTTESVRRAAYLFCWGFERPNEKYAHEARREEKAVEMYNKHNTVGQKIAKGTINNRTLSFLLQIT